jgi:MucR family transcriptional regulator, transcriptional regulator of exopolysaccharide biosynthesis
MSQPDNESILKMTTEIAVAYLNHNSIVRNDISKLIFEIRSALEVSPDAALAVRGEGAPGGEETAVMRRPAPDQPSALLTPPVQVNKPTPAVSIEDSVHEDYIISLEDGGRFRSLRRHLMAKYGMTPDDYRRKWSLPHDYPMVAPSYARDRSEVAKRIGLGRKPSDASRAVARRRRARSS